MQEMWFVDCKAHCAVEYIHSSASSTVPSPPHYTRTHTTQVFLSPAISSQLPRPSWSACSECTHTFTTPTLMTSSHCRRRWVNIAVSCMILTNEVAQFDHKIFDESDLSVGITWSFGQSDLSLRVIQWNFSVGLTWTITVYSNRDKR